LSEDAPAVPALLHQVVKATAGAVKMGVYRKMVLLQPTVAVLALVPSLVAVAVVLVPAETFGGSSMCSPGL